MGIQVVRYSKGWAVLREGKAWPLAGSYPTTADFLARGVEEARRGGSGPGVDPGSLELLSPVTTPCQVVCQGKNYADHAREMGVRPEDRTYNIFFAKAHSTIAPGQGVVRRPPGVRLLDYEIELGLVIGRALRGAEKIGDLDGTVAALVICNDVSARDVQVPEGQWFRGKSFRGFCPVGPILHVLEPGEARRIAELELELSVNGAVRQKASASQMIYGPAETLSQLSATFDLLPGDLILTGTPAGVAMGITPEWNARIKSGEFKDERAKNEAFVEDQTKRPGYLKDGDRVVGRIRTPDGAIDLGMQELEIR
jgi:2,4-didehydro-3-deoxy-L-rhamnonate hydrolase